MRVLVCRLSALGDVVCSLPVAAAMRRTFPDAVVVWVVDRRFRGVVDACTAVDRVVERPRRLGEVRTVVRDLGEFDFAIDVQGLLKSALVVGAARARRKLGYHWQREGAGLFSQAVAPDPSSLHVVDQYVDVARAAGAVADRAEFALAPRPDDLATVRQRLAERGRDDRPLVLMNASAGWATKQWAPEKYAALADLATAHGAQAAFLGGPGDRPAFEAVARAARSPLIDMVGATTVAELVALVSLARVHVGGDTGSTHLAAALGVPAVGIYRLTQPVRSCPYGQIDRCLTGDPEPSAVFNLVRAAWEASE